MVYTLPGMELNHLRYFYEVAKAGSFTAAARLLRVSQPSLSKAVALLEAREGVKLLERSKSGVHLSELGERIYSECEKIFNSVTQVEKICQGTQSLCAGLLRFGASDHLANYFLVEPIDEMVQTHPEVIPTIFVGSPNDIIQRLNKREIEFGLFFTKVKAPQITYQPLVAISMAAVYHSKLLSTGEGEGAKSRAKFVPNRYIGSIRTDFKNTPAQEILASFKKAPEVHIETNSQEMQKRLCLNGAGLAVLARFMVEAELASGELVEIPQAKSSVMWLHLAKRSSHTLSLNAKTFLDLLQVKRTHKKGFSK
jgi:DNA-binding transcriptional LysR family regulator